MKMSASFSSHACVANNGVRKLTEVFSFGSLLFQLMVLATLSGLAWAVPPPSELAGPNQLAAALADAKRIEFSGRIPDMRDPNNPGERIKLAQLPCVLERPEDIRQVSAFFAGAKLKEDKEMTQVFREGATLSAAIYVQIVIDEKSSFTILSSTLCLFADDVTYVAHGFDDQPETFFSRELMLLLGRIQKAAR